MTDRWHSCLDGVIAPGRTSGCPTCKPRRRRSPSSGTSHERGKLRRRLLQVYPLCQVGCGRPSTELHHIKAMATHRHLAEDEANALMLCRRCHLLAEGKGATLRELKAKAKIAGHLAY
jgi:5-methylcytosine-specific restriction endonuclease McrA